jgi:hypothetical protein
MRRVKVFKWDKNPEGKMVLVEDGEANFHQWGYDFEEFEEGPGTYSTAIIGRDNGKVENIPACMIQFIARR